MVKKFYMGDSKPGSIESAILGVWDEAAQKNEDPAMDALIAKGNRDAQKKRDAEDPKAAAKRDAALKVIAKKKPVTPSDIGRHGSHMSTRTGGDYNKLASSFSPEEIENFELIMDESVSTPEVEAIWKTAAEENMSGEQSYEMGTDRYRKHTQDMTPGQQVEESFQTLTEAADWLFEEIVDMSDEDFDALLEESSELELEGILGSIGRGISTAVTYGTDKSKLKRLQKKYQKGADKLKTSQDIATQKQKNIDLDDKRKAHKKANPGIIRRTASKVGALGRAAGEKIKKSMEEVELEDVQKESTTNLRDTIVNMWSEASSAVNPNDRDELDKEVDGKGGSETAKRMKHADEPKPGIKSEALSAKQKQLDIDGDGEIEASDLKKLRKKGAKKVETKEDITFAQAQDFKVDSMKQALAKVWGLDEWKNTKENRRVDGGDKRRSEQKKGGKTDTGGKMAEVEIDPELKDKK